LKKSTLSLGSVRYIKTSGRDKRIVMWGSAAYMHVGGVNVHVETS